MYDNLPVLDVHGHVSTPQAANYHVVRMLATNTPIASPIGTPGPGPRA